VAFADAENLPRTLFQRYHQLFEELEIAFFRDKQIRARGESHGVLTSHADSNNENNTATIPLR
jgi:hypothetical protein